MKSFKIKSQYIGGFLKQPMDFRMFTVYVTMAEKRFNPVG